MRTYRTYKAGGYLPGVPNDPSVPAEIEAQNLAFYEELPDDPVELNELSVSQTLAADALARLQAAREAGTSVYQTLGTVPAGTMTTATLSTVVRQMAEAQRTLIRDALDEMAAVERLLVRAVAGLYDAAD